MRTAAWFSICLMACGGEVSEPAPTPDTARDTASDVSADTGQDTTSDSSADTGRDTAMDTSTVPVKVVGEGR